MVELAFFDHHHMGSHLRAKGGLVKAEPAHSHVSPVAFQLLLNRLAVGAQFLSEHGYVLVILVFNRLLEGLEASLRVGERSGRVFLEP